MNEEQSPSAEAMNEALDEVVRRHPYNACAYSRALADRCEQFRLQVDPDVRELEEEDGVSPDPFGEEDAAAGCLGLKQRFPDRVLVMTSDSCCSKTTSFFCWLASPRTASLMESVMFW